MPEEPEEQAAKRGRGRPRSDVERQKVTVSLRKEWLEQIDRISDLREQRTGQYMSRSDVIRLAIRDYLARAPEFGQRLSDLSGEETAP